MKSSIATILEVQRAVNSLDRKGKLAILNDLMKQDLDSKGGKRFTSVEQVEDRFGIAPKTPAQPVTYKGGGE